MRIAPTSPDRSVIVLQIPAATAELLMTLADTLGLHVSECAATIFQQAVLAAAIQERAASRHGEAR